MIKGLLMAPCAAVVAFIGLNIFISDPLFLLGIPALIFLALLYMAIFSENIHFELEDDGILRYYKRSKLKNTYNLETCLVGYHSKSDGTSTDIAMHIHDMLNDTEEIIDCSPIGEKQFQNMYARLKGHTKEEPEVLRA